MATQLMQEGDPPPPGSALPLLVPILYGLTLNTSQKTHHLRVITPLDVWFCQVQTCCVDFQACYSGDHLLDWPQQKKKFWMNKNMTRSVGTFYSATHETSDPDVGDDKSREGITSA